MLYGTTTKFMEYFGINDLAELPAPKEFTGDVNTIGENAESKEEPTASTTEEPEAAAPENTDEASATEPTATNGQDNAPDMDADSKDLKEPDAQA
jgi:hypothetical protein